MVPNNAVTTSVNLTGKKVLILVLNEMRFDTRVFKQGETLRHAGAEVVTLALWDTGLKREEEQENGRTVRFYLRSRSWSRSRFVQIFKWIEFLVRVIAFAWKWKPDVIHANDWNTLPAAWLIARLRRIRYIYDSHEYWLESAESVSYPRPLRWIQQRVETRFGSSANAFITVSRLMQERIGEYIHNPNSFLVHNSWLADKPADDEKPRGWNKSRPLKILYLGGLTPGRGIEAMLQGIARVPGVVLDIYGYGNSREKLEFMLTGIEVVSEINLKDPVHHSKINALAREYDMGAIPYPPRPLGTNLTIQNKFFDYCGAGLAHLTSRREGFQYWFAEHPAGVIFEAEDSESVAQAVHRVVEHPEQVAHWQQESLAIARMNNYETARNELLHVYHFLLSHR